MDRGGREEGQKGEHGEERGQEAGYSRVKGPVGRGQSVDQVRTRGGEVVVDCRRRGDAACAAGLCETEGLEGEDVAVDVGVKGLNERSS